MLVLQRLQTDVSLLYLGLAIQEAQHVAKHELSLTVCTFTNALEIAANVICSEGSSQNTWTAAALQYPVGEPCIWLYDVGDAISL